MSDFAVAKKKTFAVYIKTRKDGVDSYLREQYNIVEYDISDPNRVSYIEGLRNDWLISSLGIVAYDFSLPDRFDDVRFYDTPPFPWARIGSIQ